MKHPIDEAIITYLYNEAGADEISAIEKHISECSDCAHKIEGIRQTIFNIDQMDDCKASKYLEDKIAGFFEKISEIKDSLTDNFKDNITGSVQNQNRILTPSELSAYLKLPIESIYELLDEIPHLILAGQIRFRKTSIEKWLDSREKKPELKKAARRDFDDSFKLWQNVI